MKRINVVIEGDWGLAPDLEILKESAPEEYRRYCLAIETAAKGLAEKIDSEIIATLHKDNGR